MKRDFLFARGRWLAAIVLALALAPATARAVDGSQVVPGGGEITYTGATETSWVNNADGTQDFLIKFADPETEGTFTFPGMTQARILAIGGGGGGAGEYTRAYVSPWGGAGGGGAGGFLEVTNMFSAGSFTVSVGAGGAGGAKSASASASYVGGDGGATVVQKDEAEFMTAYGGGGGGGYTDGSGTTASQNRGSGGGGSKHNTTGAKVGGKGFPGQGNDGGAGDADLLGGGGGGAGAVGSAASAGGAGGDGRPSDITGAEVYYAGGGGGGYADYKATSGTAIPGGNGGGGAGGYGRVVKPVAGTDGLGGGGGGADGYYCAGAVGGSGVVIVRISGAMPAGGLAKPTDVNIAYDGNPHTSYQTSPFYTVSGVSTATDIGVYPVTVALIDGKGLTWADGTDDPVAVTMTIYDPSSQSGTAMVMGFPVAYVGASAVTRVGDDELLITFTKAGSFTLPGTTKARILAVGGGGGGAGEYTRAYVSPWGGAGGGGAGGFLEVTNMFSAGNFAVRVGAGGAGGAKSASSSASYIGGDGGDTKIWKDATDYLTAYGGGGGGGYTDGSGTTVSQNRGSGGGGSKHNMTGAKVGGKGFSGQGNDGGAGDADLLGGGGGGAGAVGSAASAGGAGGDGRPSDITGAEVYYAGGGGGGYADYKATSGAAIPGGNGGGGAGGYGRVVKPVAGTDGLGGGGGGADGYYCAGAAGGSGVVIVRIIATMSGELVKPEKVQEYTYDTNAHTSVLASAFYDFTGDNVGTTCGVYKATVTLKPGYTWAGGDTESPLDVTMTIKPVEVTIANFAMASWQYTVYPDDKPEPTYTCTPSWFKPIVEYEVPCDAGGTEWSIYKPYDVGSYRARARLPDTKNYHGETQYAQFQITKREVTFTDLFQKDWMEGTPDEAIPKPRCTVDPNWVEVHYQYAAWQETIPDEAWSDDKPTAIGTYVIRVLAPDKENYAFTPATATFKIVKGRGGTFVDYVEITVAGYTGSDPAELTNFPYRIELSEALPVGFLYSRAGEDGEELGFTDANGDDLLYRVDNWDTHGTSSIYVRIPLIGAEEQVIRLYWKLRSGATAPDHDPTRVFETWTKKKAEAITQPTYDFDLVVREGYRVNYWKRLPTLSPTVWDVTGTPGVLAEGELAEGTYTKSLINSVSGALATFPPKTAGAYRYIFTLEDPASEYEALESHLDFAVTASTPMDYLGGSISNLTLNGRVLLVNDDAAVGHEVSGQSYWRTDPETQPIFWQHSGSHGVAKMMTNLYRYEGTNHRLQTIGMDGKTNLIWRLEDVLLGNTFYGTKISAVYCGLPWSLTALGMSSESAPRGTRDEAGCMCLRNTTSAAIYSPCYTNGIGTIYFDAVNTYKDSTKSTTNYTIVVEYATNVLGSANQSLLPTDENCRGDSGTGTGETEFGRLTEDVWHRLTVIPLCRDNDDTMFSRLTPTNVVALNIGTGGSTNNFYRICANLDYRGPVRFRIRRVGTLSGQDLDWITSFIQIDNIIVSYPKSAANLSPLGVFDSSRGGKQTLGQEGAFSVPFPAVEETEAVYGGATNEIYLSDAAQVDPRSLVLLSRMHYRWRYGSQVSNEWQFVDLSPFDDFHATTPLNLPYDEGDLEFWYESFMNVPFYQYYDYSGAGIGLCGLYTEETGTLTNRLNRAAYGTFSGPGDDWFVRFRAGKSDWNEFRVAVSNEFFEDDQPMELIGNHLWRGLVKVPTNASGIASIQFRGTCRRGAWGEVIERDAVWYPTENATKMPGRGECTPVKTSFGYPADGASNYVEFQFNDETGAFTVGHAEYQSFNLWHDAHREDGKFVGQYPDETNGVNVVDMITTNAHMRTWSTYTESNDNWNEAFLQGDDSGYPKYTDYLLSHKMPHQWAGENGFFVDTTLVNSNATARKTGSGLAWQMRGSGVGSVSFTSTDTPSGIGTISFRAHLAQTVDFNDFSIVGEQVPSTTKNYTFVVPALMSYLNGTDSAPHATLSVVGYYDFRKGGYEFRVERDSKDGMLFAIYKWYSTGGNAVKSELIGQHWFKGAACDQNSNAKTPSLYAMFISVGEEISGQTTIIGGLSRDPAQPSSTYSDKAYRAICCIDTSSTRFTQGKFGCLSSNCSGYLMDPRYWSAVVTKAKINPVSETTGYAMYKGYTDNVSVTFAGSQTKCRCEVNPWYYGYDRAELLNLTYSGNEYYGFRAPSLKQTVDVLLKPVDGNEWTLYDSKTVSSYGFTTLESLIRTNENCHVRLRTGTLSTDVTVHDIKQTAWSGEDINNLSGLSKDFIYTQAYIYDDIVSSGGTKTTNRYCKLQPARVKSDKPLSIRSPILKGLGMVEFSYRDVQPGAEVWVQIATNNVRDNLNGTGGYNYSLKSVEMGVDEPVGTWITVKKYGYDELSAASLQSYYIGLHDRVDVPLEGAIRIFVPPTVCETARAGAKTAPDYGAITITDILVHDEPALNTRSWFGWNLRTVGDATDSERRMYLPDMSSASDGYEPGRGLSAALNNSTTADIAGDKSKFDKINPTIQSPTFSRYSTPLTEGQATIGQVSFRARLYDEGNPAKVWIYGASNSAATEWGEPITNFTVSSTRYKLFTYKAPSSQNYAAIRLTIDGVMEGQAGLRRVLLDEIVVSEKNNTTVGFYYLRPFRSGLENDLVIENILDKDQQPLSDESWGVQTKLKFDSFAEDVDYDRGFRVTFQYFKGASPWGYENWKDLTAASGEIDLKQVGSKSDYTYRSTALDPETIVSPGDANTVVQYTVKVYYYEKGNDTEFDLPITVSETDENGWTNPDWYWPVDKNRLDDTTTGDWKSETSPYTILESIAPGRAWINEVNYNDGCKDENGNVRVETNQFVEIAVPWGIDMTGWRLRLTDFKYPKNPQTTLAVLGKSGVPSSKKSSHKSGDYDFFVLQSTKTKDEGGIRDPETGEKAADGTWADTIASGTISSGGTLKFEYPYQFELVRPSGIVEHQFVVGGTNIYAYPHKDYSAFGYLYDGTNLVNDLNDLLPSTKRFYAGDDHARLASDATVFSSFGVTGAAHGEEGGWSSEMRFTPGRINEGQDALTGWYIKPSGGSCWVYVKLDPSATHLSQQIGEDTSSDTFVLVNQGNATSVVYTVKPWYQLDKIHRVEDGVTNTTIVGAKGSYTFDVKNVKGTTEIIATEAIDADLIKFGRLNPADRYTPAVMRWLEAGMANGKAFKHPEGPIQSMTYRGFAADATNVTIGVKGMYWFDVDPTEGGWWLRGDWTKIDPVQRTWYTNGVAKATYDNMQIQVCLYLSNETSRVVYAPNRLQGPNNEKSDDRATYSSWTGETFKVEGMLLNDMQHNAGYLPFRNFVFDANSFDAEYNTTIEIVDPFSPESLGFGYGWSAYKGKYTPVFRWNLDERLLPIGVETLKADSTYEGKRPWVK